MRSNEEIAAKLQLGLREIDEWQQMVVQLPDADWLTIIAALRSKPTSEHLLRNLLARIHRDGGHYTEAHGLEKAVADADVIVARLFAKPTSKQANAIGKWPPYKGFEDHVRDVIAQLWAEREKPGSNTTALRQGGSLLGELLLRVSTLAKRIEELEQREAERRIAKCNDGYTGSQDDHRAWDVANGEMP